MRILVTGGARFIGSHFVRLLLPRGDTEVINLDALRYSGNLDNLRDVSNERTRSDRHLAGISLEDQHGRAYSEQAFRHLLTIERKRSERSGCPSLLLLIDLEDQEGASARLDSMVANSLFSNLWRCLRETDCVGWYYEERVAGAVLTELGNGRPMEVSSLIGKRVREALCELIPPDVARCLRVRIYQHPERERIEQGETQNA